MNGRPKAVPTIGTQRLSAQAPVGQDPWLSRHQPAAFLGRVQCLNCHWPYPCPTRLTQATR
jgi:hypothetical protein